MAEQIEKPKIKRSLFRKIINVFIAFFLGIVLISIILLGFTQTITFRNWLRDKVVTIANDELNGKLNIEKIDGTILTSIFLRNTSLTVDGDTLVFAKSIEIKTSPLQLLLKKIYFRKILFDGIKIKLLQDSTGQWNYAKLAKPSEEDTTESSFPFTIQVNDFRLKEISLTQQTFENRGSKKIYDIINFDDLKIDNLFLSASAFIDIDNSDYLLQLKEFSFKPNLTRFALRNISGDFALTKDFVNVSNFAFITDSSDVRINARLDSLNLFGGVELEDFKNYPVTIELDASSFNFDDLSSFIGSTEILKGNPSLELKGHGKFGDINIDKAILDYKTTHFEFTGRVLNLNTPEKLYIKAQIKDTDINYKDVNILLPSLELPDFAKLSVSSVNIEYEGEPTNFKSKFSGNIENGALKFTCAMNLNSNPPKYDIKFETNELDLEPVIGITTSLNSVGSLIGKGFSPVEMNSKFRLNIVESEFNELPVDEFIIKSDAADRKIELDIDGSSINSEIFVTGQMLFDNDTVPEYSLVGSIKELDLASVMNDDNYKSDLNFYFSAEGRNIDPDKINGTFSFGVDSSNYSGTSIPYSNIDIVFNNDSTGRSINLVSDFLDFNIDGDFSVNKAVELLAYESSTISEVISEKLDELNPLNIVDQSGKADSIIAEMPGILNEEIKFDYSFRFKNFDLIASLIGNNRLDIVGSGKGSIDNSTPNFSINSELNLDYIVFMQKELTVYLSDILLNINFTRDNRFNSFDKLSGAVTLKGKRFYSSVNVENINAGISFNESKINFNISADIENNISTNAEGYVAITPIQQQIIVNDLNVLYDGLMWQNDGQIRLFFNPYRFNIADLTLIHDTSYVKTEGTIDNDGTLNLLFAGSKLSGNVLSRYLAGTESKDFIANGNFKATIRGDFDNPVINANLSLDNLAINNYKLGNLTGKLNYDEKKIETQFYFLDSTYNSQKPLLALKGTIPIDLTFASVENRFPENESIDIKLTSENFNLNSLGNLIPAITKQSGIVNADIRFTGALDKPNYSGYLKLNDGLFTSAQNNLEYSCSADLAFENNGIRINNITVANTGGTQYPGKLSAFGSIILENLAVKDLNISINGDLALLSSQSRSVSPLFYGDLSIGSSGDWILSKRGDRYFFKGDIRLLQTDLTYTTTQEQSVQKNNFNFIYVVDSTKIDKELIRFQEILSAENNDNKKTEDNGEEFLNFDYEIGVSVYNNARANFILSQAANQKLFVDMRGDLKYESYNSNTRAQGAFEIMQDSKLDFLGKTFDATGFIRFESDITNPYLDVTATYQNEYIDPRNSKAVPQEVAVKIRIKGPLSDLGKNLSTNQESIGVYVGSRDIQNDTRDYRYDYSDAFSFILFGKFKDDLTAQDKNELSGQTNIVGNTATSVLGSVLTSFVNSAVGDLINNIQISNTGDQTKFSLSGRTKNLRYSFGGTTEVFQRIEQANFKLEYGSTFLIRLERRDPIVQTNSLGDKINEIALKYKFEF